MAVTEQTYTGNGSTTNYSFTFPYLKSTDIQVQVDAAVTTAWSLANATTVQFNTAPASGALIKILRDTNVDNLTATFYAGSALKSEDLNDNFTQNLYVTQEIGNRSFENTGTTTMVGNLLMGEDTSVVFEGATDNTYETKLTVADPTADRTITLPNITGTVITNADTGTVTSNMIGDGTIVAGDIASNAVTTAKINVDAVTTTKLADANVTTAKIADANITTAKIADSNVTTAKINNAAVTTAKITDANVTTAKIAADAIDGTKLADNAIDSEHYTDGSIDTAHIADAQITTSKIAADNITSALIADDQIDSEHYAAGSIDTAHIADSQITTAKLGADCITAAKIGDDQVTTDHIADAELVTLAGMQAGTASKLAGGTALTADLADLNQIDGMTKETTVTDDDAKFPTSGAVVDYVAAQIAPIGGLEVIATDAAFPNTQPAAGVVISIADAGGLVVNGSGTSTTGRTVGASTVTINNIASNFNSSTIDAGVAMMVSSTGSGQIYNYHKATLKEADLLSLSNDINDFAARYRVVSGEPGSGNDEGDLIYDTAADKMKVYDSTTSAFKEVTSTGDFKYLFLCPAGGSGAPTIDGSIATYDLRESSNTGAAASVINAAQLLVSINGVVQKANTGTSAPAEGFALVDANTIIFGSNLATGDQVFIHQIGSAVSIPTPGDDTVATAKIQNGAVTQAKLGDQAVNEAKLQISNSGTNGQYLQKQSGNTGGLTWETVVATPTTTRGDIIYRAASADARLAKGTAGQYLKIGANDPEWADVIGAVAGGCIYENDQTISADHTIAAGKGAHSVGPVTVSATVTVNGRWVIS